MHADSDGDDENFFLAHGEADEDDEDFFLAWLAAYGHTCNDAELTKAKAATKHLLQRPRRLTAETWHAWLRAAVRLEMKAHGKKDAAVVATRDHFGLLPEQERTIWTAIKPLAKPAQPKTAELDRERIFKLLVANIRVAEESGNQQAAEFLRCQLRRFETRGRL
jgi:hypothetical protein